MPEYDNELSGVLFKNEKDGNDRRPDYTGNVTIEGTEYRLAAWIKTSSRSGEKFMSLKASLPQEQTAGVASGSSEGEDDIPFAYPHVPNMEHGPTRSRDLFVKAPETF